MVVVYISSILFVFHSRVGAGLLWRNCHDRKKSSGSCQNTSNTSGNDLLAKILLPHPNSEVLSLWLAFFVYPLFDVAYRL